MKCTLCFNKAGGAAGMLLILLLANGTLMAGAPATPLSYNVRQQRDVTGTVRDAKGNPLPGVTVSLKGSNKGTKTDINGFYRIPADPEDILVFSYIGHAVQEITVGIKYTISTTMEENVKGLDELVVTALGIRKGMRSTGYAVSIVEGGDLTKAREISVATALEGRVAGVNSTPPATGPGGSSRITIRGNSSLNRNNQPLFVVNGIPLNNDNLGSAGKYGGTDLGDGISSINPDDIDEMTVLKGGAASALYGQRGINGVILITTKSGKAGQLNIDFNSNVTVEKVNDFLDFQDVYGQGVKGARPSDLPSALSTGLMSWGEKMDGAQTTHFDGQLHPYSKQGSHIKDFYKTGITYSNTLSVAGGSDKTTYRFAAGDLRSDGIYPNTRYFRDNVNLDLNYKLSSQWSGQTNITYIKEITNNRTNLSDAPGNGNYGIAFLPPNVKADYLAPGYDDRGYETAYSSDQFSTNPYFAANRFMNNTGKDRVLGVTSLRYSPLPWFYIQGRVANDYFGFNATSITPTGTAYRPKGSLDLERNRQFNETNADLLISVSKSLNKSFHINVNAGANLLKKTDRTNDVNASVFAFPFVYNPATAATKNSTTTLYRKEIHSVYGSVELAWKNLLYLNITDRNDWSSTLPIVSNSYNYPSANLSYVFSESLKKDWLYFGKIRAGYSQVGGDADEYKTKLYYSTLGSTINGVYVGDISNEVPSRIIKPLTATEIEAGLELKLFKNRFFTDFSWYNKQISNDIVAATVSYGSGFTTEIVNVGQIENKGIELLIGGSPVQTGKFTWTTSVNIASNNNKVLQLAPGQKSMLVNNGESRTEAAYIQQVVGLPFGQIMVYDLKRNDKGALIVDAAGLPQRTDALVPMGSGISPLTGGWNNELTYRNMHLSFLIDFKSGGKIYSGTNANAYGYGLHKETLPGREGNVTVEGVTEEGTPVSRNIDAQTYYTKLSTISSLHVYKTDFIKFRSVSLTYDLNSNMLHTRLQAVSISLVGRNLFYLKRSTPNIDPESNYSNSNAQGLEYAGLPSTRSFGLNLNVTF